MLLRMLSACAPHIGFWINPTAYSGQDQDPSNETIAVRAVRLICWMPDWFGLFVISCGSSSVFHALRCDSFAPLQPHTHDTINSQMRVQIKGIIKGVPKNFTRVTLLWQIACYYSRMWRTFADRCGHKTCSQSTRSRWTVNNHGHLFWLQVQNKWHYDSNTTG